jgi:chromosome segregation and condensation protein ScpB
VEVLQPVWAMPRTEVERAVVAALVLAGEPINNRRLAELMGTSPGEASKRVAQLEGVIRKARKCREVLISLH